MFDYASIYSVVLNGNVVILATFSSMLSPKVVISLTYGRATNVNFFMVAKLSFQGGCHYNVVQYDM